MSKKFAEILQVYTEILLVLKTDFDNKLLEN